MIAVGIPSYNEADSISQLVGQIDEAACSLGIPIIIVNADNSSPDGTQAIFSATQTVNAKISLQTHTKGKGHNLRAIMRQVIQERCEYCLFVDADVKSFEPEWLKLHDTLAKDGADYVVPNYARNMQEGNATNHLFYPLLHYHTKGQAPYQPIAGDVGMSQRLITYLLDQDWSSSTLGYGVDIFITMHALLSGFNTIEVKLGRKIHKPSYGKMITIFEEAASSYFEARSTIHSLGNKIHFTRLAGDSFTLLSGEPITSDEITSRAAYAFSLLKQLPTSNAYPVQANGINDEVWATVLADHEHLVGNTSPSIIVKSLLPWYLLRVTNYLATTTNASDAVRALQRQTSLISGALTTTGI